MELDHMTLLLSVLETIIEENFGERLKCSRYELHREYNWARERVTGLYLLDAFFMQKIVDFIPLDDMPIIIAASCRSGSMDINHDTPIWPQEAVSIIHKILDEYDEYSRYNS